MRDDSLYMKVRTAVRAQVLNLLSLNARPAPGIHILNGHRICGEAEPDTFRRLLDRLAQQVTLVRAEDAVAMIERHEQPDRPCVAFTFDDGFSECADIFAPVLEEYGGNAIFFVNPNYVEGDDAYIRHFNHDTVQTAGKRPMRWDTLKDLAARGHIIGAHTLDHYMIVTDDRETLRHQIVDCRRVIEEHIGNVCDYFAFPYGQLSQASETAIDIAAAAYAHVFSQSDYKHYYSFGGKVINRRHFEPFWPVAHVKYFLNCKKTY